MAGKICPYCYGEFTPHPKVGDRHHLHDIKEQLNALEALPGLAGER
jgi:hypothetical protein